jgi:hypothetical protein
MIQRVSTPSFPSHYEKNKNKDWIKKFGKACWDDWNSIDTNSFYKGRERYSNVKSFMLGEQDGTQYLNMFDSGSANNEKQWLKAFKEVLQIVPKFRRIAISSLIKTIWEINLQAIDPTSVEEKNDYYAQNKARLILKKLYKEQGLNPSDIPDTDDNFLSEEDLDLFMEYSYKNRMAIEAQMAIRLIMNNCDYDSIRERQFEQLHDHGFIGIKDYFDQNGDPKVRGVDVKDVIVSRCKEVDFSDAIYQGEVLDLSIADIKEMDIDKEISKIEYDLIAEKIQRSNIGTYEVQERKDPDFYENQRAQVLDLIFFSVNEYTVESGENKLGNPVMSRRDLDKSKPNAANEYIKKEYKCIYECKWVVGTDIWFGCKLQTNMKRPKHNISDVVSPYHFFAPDLNNMETKSLGESYIPIAHMIQLLWLKYQDVVVSARKKGYAIEISSLENMPLGKGGVQFTPSDALEFIKKTGIVVYRRLDEQGKNASYRPVEELANGIGDEASRYFNEIMNNIALLQQITGLNEVTDGSTPEPRLSNGVAKMALDSTNNSIDFLKRAQRSVLLKLAQSLVIRIQDAAKWERLEGFVNALGRNSIEFFKLNPDLSTRELGIEIKDEPTEVEKEDLRQTVNMAIQNGQITIADKYAIMNIKDVDHAQALLRLRITQNIDKQQEINLQNIEANAKTQQDSLAMSAQIKQGEIQTETQAKIALLQAEEQKELNLLDRKYTYELQLKEMEVTGRIGQNQIQADAKIYAADRQSKTKEVENATQLQNSNIQKVADMEHEKEMAEMEPETA